MYRLKAGFKTYWFVLMNGELAYYDAAGENIDAYKQYNIAIIIIVIITTIIIIISRYE